MSKCFFCNKAGQSHRESRKIATCLATKQAIGGQDG